MMLRRFFMALLLLVASPAAGAAIVSGASISPTVSVALGKGRLVHLPRPASSVFIADPAVADVEVRSPRLIYLFGRGAGETSFFAIDAADQPIDSFSVRVGYDEELLRAVLAENLPGRPIEVSTVHDALVLSGEVTTAAEAEDAIELARRFVAGRDRELILNRLSITAPTQINLRVRIAEVSREIVRNLGFNWDALGTFGNVTTGITSGRPFLAEGVIGRAEGEDGLFGRLRTGSLDINGLIDALDQRGLVRILAEPNLTALSGVPASFLAGGEYPIPVPQGDNVVTIEYKRFGVSLAFVATITDGGRINLAVRPEVSQLSTAGAMTMNGLTVPALTTRRVETEVDLASGQSFAIAGLLQSDQQQDLRKFPGLGDIPVLGELFRSRRFKRNETELVVIVTPYLVHPVDNAAVHIPRMEKP